MAFTPGSNTLLYVPLKTDFNDVTQHGTVGTNTGELKSIGGVTAGYYESVNETEITSSTNIGTSSTMLAWVYNNGNGCIYGTDGGRHGFGVHTHNLYFYNGTEYKSTGIVFQDSWYLIAIAQDTNSVLFYANCNEDRIKINEVVSISNSLNPSLGGRIGGQNPWGGVSDQYISNLIIENRKWTIEEIEAYFNSTKADYGYEPDPVPGLKKAGIYHNPTLGLISLSSGDGNWITIADKNLGATSTDITNTSSYGKYFQWGNNYGRNTLPSNISTTKINASSYGPGNYYSSSTFINGGDKAWYWDTSNNNALWEGQGPCNSGFHVPTSDELQLLRDYCSSIGGDFNTHLKIPRAGYLSYGGENFYSIGSQSRLWSSTGIDISNAYCDWQGATSIWKGYGYPIRPFANTPTEPDSSWAVLYGEEFEPIRIIKKFYHMGVEYKIKGGKPTPSYKTYTVSYTEASTPVFTYSDDAETMTAGSSEWDEIFGYYPCLLNTSGVETAKLNPNDYSKTIDGASANITSGDNVMVMFPRRGYKISKSGSTVTVSITTDPNKEGYCYDAFRRGTTQKDKFYLGAYHGSLSGSVLKSWSGKSIAVNHNITNGRTYAQANGTGYEQWAFNQLTYLQCLWILKYKNLNSQSTLGQGYIGGSAATTTGATNTNGLNCGSTSSTTHVKLFGIEDFWGNVREWIDGIYCDSSYNIWTGTDNFTSTAMTTNYTNQGSAGISSNIGNYISAVQGTSTTGFIAKAVSGSSSTYYSDYGSLYAGCFPSFGGDWSSGSVTGVFRLDVDYSASGASSYVGSRLMFL